MDLFPLVAGLLIAGTAAGLLAGLLGVGGGIVIVPVLFSVFGHLDIDPAIRMHLAAGTSFGTMVPTAIISARSHLRRRSVDIGVLKRWAPASFFGCLVGILIAGRVRGEILTGVFAVGALVVAVYMLVSKEGSRLPWPMPGPLGAVGIGGTVGVTSSMMGIGGGTFFVPLFSALGMPVHKAVATSAALGIAVSIPGLFGFAWAGWHQASLPDFSVGYVNLLGVAIITPVATLFAPVGVRIAHRLAPKVLKLVFGAFLLATAVRMVSSIL